MAERIKEVAEIPQQFVKEGTLVSYCLSKINPAVPAQRSGRIHGLTYSSSTDAPSLLKMVSSIFATATDNPTGRPERDCRCLRLPDTDKD